MDVLTMLWLSLLLFFASLTGCAGGNSEDAVSNAGNDNSVTTSAAQVSVRIAWEGTDPSVNGYYVHYGTQSPNVPGSCAYAEHIYYSVAALASASSPTVTISGLTGGKIYYFAVSAANDNVEGTCSNEIWKPM
jgi:hypothetical protein